MSSGIPGHRSFGSHAAELTPAEIDSVAYPIIAQHWFGFGPARASAQVRTTALASLRRHRQFEHVHRLGPRAIEELAIEVANGEDLDRALSAYDRLTTEMLKATGGDRFPAQPIHEVGP